MRKRDVFGKVRSIVRKYGMLDYLYSCWIKRKDKEFSNYARDMSTSTMHIERPMYNKTVRAGMVYHIKSGNSFSGFGAEFRRTLDALYFADYYGFLPVIEYTQKYIYAEKEEVNHTRNPFEYYFCQPTEIIDVEEHLRIRFREEHRGLAENIAFTETPYEISEKYIYNMGVILQKYIRLRPEVAQHIKTTMDGIGFDKKPVIGVHYRGTDFNSGYKNHPNVVGVQDYFKNIDELINEISVEISIFLATDDINVIKQFKEYYGDKIIYFSDTLRSEDGSAVHFSDNNRDLHKYTLGLEILRDIVALSRCEYLVAGLSQVSFCARIFKSSNEEKYRNMIIINKGIR